MLLYRDAGISAVAFHPNRRAAVSSSYGGDFKVILVAGILVVSSLFSQIVYSVIFLMCQVWICNDELQQKDLQSSGWSCHAVGSYKYDLLYFLLQWLLVYFPCQKMDFQHWVMIQIQNFCTNRCGIP